MLTVQRTIRSRPYHGQMPSWGMSILKSNHRYGKVMLEMTNNKTA